MELNFRWTLHLKSPPDRLWQYIADTGSLNQAAGLPEWKLSYVPEADGGSHQFGEARYKGWRLRWDEHPFEWIEGRQYSVLREYHNGPMRSFRMSVRLEPEDGGTYLEETITIEPRWVLIAPAIYWEVGFRSRRRFKRVYREIDGFVQGKAPMPFAPVDRRMMSLERMAELRARLGVADTEGCLARLIEVLETFPDKDLDRMRAYAFVDRWGAGRREVLRLFLNAAALGLLDLSWDVICPSCRGAKVREGRLRDLRLEAHCDACNIRYTADFSKTVEVTFRPGSAIRRLEVADYCSGGPMNAPHVVAQQHVTVGESRTIPLRLQPWRYRLRSLKLDEEGLIQVKDGAGIDEVTMTFTSSAVVPGAEASIEPEASLTIRNASDKPHTVMLERSADRHQASTAAEVTTFPEFRSMFSEEVLSPDTEVSAGTLSIMFTDLRSSTAMYEQVGDTSAYARVRQHFEVLRGVVESHDGTFVKTIGDAVMAVFADPARAVGAALLMHKRIEEDNREQTPSLTLKIGIHRGRCFAVNLNKRLDYFGTSVNIAARIQKESRGGDVVVSDEVLGDGEVGRLLESVRHTKESVEVEIRGLSGSRRVHRLVARADPRDTS